VPFFRESQVFYVALRSLFRPGSAARVLQRRFSRICCNVGDVFCQSAHFSSFLPESGIASPHLRQPLLCLLLSSVPPGSSVSELFGLQAIRLLREPMFPSAPALPSRVFRTPVFPLIYRKSPPSWVVILVVSGNRIARLSLGFSCSVGSSSFPSHFFFGAVRLLFCPMILSFLHFLFFRQPILLHPFPFQLFIVPVVPGFLAHPWIAF